MTVIECKPTGGQGPEVWETIWSGGDYDTVALTYLEELKKFEAVKAERGNTDSCSYRLMKR